MSIPEDDRPAPASRWGSALGEAMAWLTSLATHAAVLIFLGLFATFTPLDKTPLLFSSPPPEEPEELDEEFRVSEELSVDIGALSDGGTGDAAAAAPIEAMLNEVSLDLEPVTDVGQIPTLEASTPLLTSPDPDNNLLVRGVGAVGTSGSRGAVDRLTGEILLSLEQRPTVVVWLFDRSGSLAGQREEIVRRFDRVYEELGVAVGDTDKEDPPLQTTVAAFAADIEFVTPRPTADVEAIKAAVRSISPDESGQENVFGAILEAVDRHKRYRLRKPRHNVMIVVITDEAGDDLDRLDRTVEVCRKMQTPVYVVGTPAPFGRVDSYVRYVDPDPKFDQTPQYLPVRQGPESLDAERLRLGYFGSRDFDGPTLDSGFGPFGLTRLSAETGGFYIAVHPFRVQAGRANRDVDAPMTANIDYFFDERLMRRYRPDYVPTGEYRRRLAENGAKQALVAAAKQSWTAPLQNVRRTFPKLNDAQFAEDLTRAQRAAAILAPSLDRLVTTLRRGEADRAELDSPRWQAGFDLAMGRALASKIRAEGYNEMLAMAKGGMEFSSERKDTWIISPSNAIATGSRAAAEADEAKRYLTRVVEEHDGTPWALLAKRELTRPLGWEWRDEFRDLAERQRRQANNNANNRPRPNRPEPKPRRDPPRL
ncbi:MAG: vWA domain-containing protein [Planctomycetota bacterium]